MLARYTHGEGLDEAFAEFRSGASSYYEADGLNSITSLTNSSATIVATYGYDSFGHLSNSTGALLNSLGTRDGSSILRRACPTTGPAIMTQQQGDS